jgi:thioredoxin-related protein
MKFSKSLLFLLLTIIFTSQVTANGNEGQTKEDKKINWLTIEEAQALGKKNPKKLFVDVYTDWCVWCKRMDQATFQDAEVVDYVNKNYYAVKLDAESKKMIKFNDTDLTEMELARAMRVSGYPTIVLLDETFTKIRPVPGFQKADAFKDMLMEWNGEKVAQAQ